VGGKLPDIVETTTASGQFQTLALALKAANLTKILKERGPFTVFAPTDEAFAKLPQGSLDVLLKDKARLAVILTYHVVHGKHVFIDLKKLESLKTMQGQSVRIRAKKGPIHVNDAMIVQGDIEVSNGVCHAINKVLLPK
jgi:uncharacterized surface protein with fasciclin (FAS1) repeats